MLKPAINRRRAWLAAAVAALVAIHAPATPVVVEPATAPHGMVVAGHPEVAALGAAVLAAGGNAMDAAVAVSLALGVAEPYGSGLGGKLMLLHHSAATGETHAVDGMDAAGGSLDVTAYRRLPAARRFDGWSAVAVPGLPAALQLAHDRWGTRPWAELVRPVAGLAREGATILPKTRDFIVERTQKLRQDAALASLFLPDGEPPPAGSRVPQPELAATLERIAESGAEEFYRGSIARAIAEAARAGGGHITADDLASYRARIVEPVRFNFADRELLGGPPPSSGATLIAAILSRLEGTPLDGPLRTAANLDRIGRAWREALPEVQATVGDAVGSRPVGALSFEPAGANDATTHFAVVDRHGNVVCATQSLSLHFGAGVAVAGIVLNDSMSNFSFLDEESPNFVAPGRRARSTMAPMIALHNGRAVLAIGAPGAQRIPTAVLQVLLDHLGLGRPLSEAIGDTRVHWFRPPSGDRTVMIEAEASLDEETVTELQALGWRVDLREVPGTGLHFGGVNAIVLHSDGSRTGFADPRRTNAAVGH